MIELKLGEFEPQDKGQVELYLCWLEKYERAEGEEKPIALILCAEKSQETIELLELDNGSIHVAQYSTKGSCREKIDAGDCKYERAVGYDLSRMLCNRYKKR